ncbi:hypothetical protein H0H92_009789 [Tricholoma furcatifolium]|nr:hypothetical protein H0H92_009789 [Tricholoma furcatifolium]
MNTTHRAPRPRLNLSPLPTEIWLDILARACTAGEWNPLTLETSIDFSLTATRGRMKLFRQSLVTKRHVVRVCKTWNVWTTPHLYENVYLGRFKSLRPLLDALQRTQKTPGIGHAHPLGWWTKRLDIAIRDRELSFDSLQDASCLIALIVECFPNLNVVCFPSDNHCVLIYPERILSSIANTSGAKLQAVVWQSTVDPPVFDDWRAFLDKAANIKMLRSPDHELQGSPPPKLNYLETLQVGDQTLLGDYPSLRRLICEVAPEPSWSDAIQLYGPRLEHLQLNIRDLFTLTPVMDLVSIHCPRLVRLDLSVNDWLVVGLHMPGDELRPPPTIKVLGLQNTSIQANAKSYRTLLNGLKQMHSTPALASIQFIDSGNAKDFVQKHRRLMLTGIAMLKRKGLELRDHEGILME